MGKPGMCLDFIRDERGATANEYALIAVICSIAIVAGLYDTRRDLNATIEKASAGLQVGYNN